METRVIKPCGNSICVKLDRGTLKNVYNLGEDDEVTVEYAFPDIIIRGKNIKNP